MGRKAILDTPDQGARDGATIENVSALPSPKLMALWDYLVKEGPSVLNQLRNPGLH